MEAAVPISLLIFFGGLLSLILLVFIIQFLRTWPPVEVPAGDRSLFRAVDSEFKKMLGGIGTKWGIFPPTMHIYDARAYAASFVIVRDVYLSDGDILNRAERELLAVGVSVSNSCFYCTYSHAKLIRSTEIYGVDEAVVRRQLDAIEDQRLRTLAHIGVYSKNPKKVTEYIQGFSPQEVGDIAAILFIFHYINRVMDALGPQPGIGLQFWAKAPPFATLLGMKRSWSPGYALPALGITPEPMADDKEANIKVWTDGRPDRLAAVRYTWNAIQTSAEELFAPELLTAIQAHVAQWNGEELPLSQSWFNNLKHQVSDPKDQERLKLAIFVVQSAHRVSPEELLEACEGDRRKRLVLVAFAACAATMRINSFLLNTEEPLELPSSGSSSTAAKTA